MEGGGCTAWRREKERAALAKGGAALESDTEGAVNSSVTPASARQHGIKQRAAAVETDGEGWRLAGSNGSSKMD